VSKLLVVNDGKRERELLLVEKLVVGRDPACDFSHDDALLSRRHAEFLTTSNEVTVRDLGSRNGVFVNGTRAAERALHPGDVVQIGPLRVRYVSDRAPVSLIPQDMDSGSTLVIPYEEAAAAVLEATELPTTDIPIIMDPVAAPQADEEGETRVFERPEGFEAAEHDQTIVVPPPPRTGSDVQPAPKAPAAARSSLRKPTIEPRPTATMPRVNATQGVASTLSSDLSSVSKSGHEALTTFVFVQLAALASVVFVASAVPLILWRGETFGSTDEGGVLALLRWPAIPIVIALGATYLIATLVNRRVLDALLNARQNPSSRGPHV
jgi:predicted component of type VI protein secretion system